MSPRCGPPDVHEPRLAVRLPRQTIGQASEFPDIEYTFKHALTDEVAHQGLIYERLSTERIAAQAKPLADHALRGQL
jgi:hypothetical protein